MGRTRGFRVGPRDAESKAHPVPYAALPQHGALQYSAVRLLGVMP